MAINRDNLCGFNQGVKRNGLEFRTDSGMHAGAARGSPVATGHLRLRHVLPGVWTPVIVITTQQVGTMMIAESSLTFLGLGIPPTVPSWGAMIADGRAFIGLAPWVSIVPGMALTTTVLAVYFCGDGLRDLLDPRLRL